MKTMILAPLVAAELSALGVPIADVSAAGVAFSADYPTLLRVNMHAGHAGAAGRSSLQA